MDSASLQPTRKQEVKGNPAQQPTEPARFVRPFPQDIYRQLNGTDLKVLEEIAWRCRVRRKLSPNKASYCIASEATIARKLRVRRETVSHSVCKLTRLGCLDTTHRRPVRGRWMSNLYKIRQPAVWRLAGALSTATRRGNRVRFAAHISSVERNIEPNTPKKGDFVSVSEILGKWKLRGGAP